MNDVKDQMDQYKLWTDTSQEMQAFLKKKLRLCENLNKFFSNLLHHPDGPAIPIVLRANYKRVKYEQRNHLSVGLVYMIDQQNLHCHYPAIYSS